MYLGKVRDDEDGHDTGGEGGLPVRKSIDKTKDNNTILPPFRHITTPEQEVLYNYSALW